MHFPYSTNAPIAKVWLQEERRKHTLRFLKTLELASFDETHRKAFTQLVKTAREQIASSVIEI